MVKRCKCLNEMNELDKYHNSRAVILLTVFLVAMATINALVNMLLIPEKEGLEGGVVMFSLAPSILIMIGVMRWLDNHYFHGRSNYRPREPVIDLRIFIPKKPSIWDEDKKDSVDSSLEPKRRSSIRFKKLNVGIKIVDGPAYKIKRKRLRKWKK